MGNSKLVGRLVNLPLFDVLFSFPQYLYLRLRQVYIFSGAFFSVLLDLIVLLKQAVVRRMFWGRGNFYKTFFHITIMVLTISLLVTGLLTRFGQTQSSAQGLTIAYGTVGNNDLLQQGGSLTTVLAIDDPNQANFKVTKYTVVSGDTLDSIAQKFGISKDTIKWANDRQLSPFNDNVQPGWTLDIPAMDGVLHEVKSGETLDSIVALTNGNRDDIIELNNLVSPSYSLQVGSKVFVPNGKVLPPSITGQPNYIDNPNIGTGYVPSGVTVSNALGNLPAGTFDDPLTNPACSGYIESRGYSPWHDGVDLAVGGGCPERAIAAGTVIYAGWWSTAGFTVMIDHGGGVISHYYHGNGDIYVKKGDYVYKGQDIMYMGETGNATGIHLHLSLYYNGVTVDPALYVPFRQCGCV